ncbi:F-box and leucine-rich repeat protein 13-like isoform X2 [Clavelina lepadiformis]|uniref:F-box and leucine-rich repeat protein 13-like isoform X2 n=1 Tax=Clavelina lepadiformis TaxID=159417 RepID=UPI004042303E
MERIRRDKLGWTYNKYDKRWTFYKFSNIVHLELTECEYVTAQILDEIRKNCKKIERLNLSGCRNVDDEAIEVVSKFEHLKILNISECSQVTDDGVIFIADMPCQILHFLSFDVQQFSDRGIVNLVSKQTKIEFLVLSGDNKTDYSVIDACHCLANLKQFHIYDCRNLTDRSIYALCGKVRLECLCLQRATKVSTQAVNHLFQEKPRLNLKDLCIGYTDAVVDDTVNAILSGCPHLERIELNFCCEVTDKSIDELIKSCRKLEVVSLQGLTSLKGDWLAEIERYLPKLHRLSMSFCSGISEEKVKHLFLRKPDLELLWNRMPINELKHEDIDHVLRNITLEDFE